MSVSRRELLGGAALLAVAAPLFARVSFLPGSSNPVLLLMDAEALRGRRLDGIAALGYVLERDVIPDCSATEYGLLVWRLRLAPQIVAVLDAADHLLVMEALRDIGAAIEFDGPLDGEAAATSPLLEPLRRVLVVEGAPSTLQALVAKRAD